MVNAGEEAGQLGAGTRAVWLITRRPDSTPPRNLQMALIYPFVLIAVAIAWCRR